MKNCFKKNARIFLVVFLSVPFIWTGYALAADNHDGSEQDHIEGNAHSDTKRQKNGHSHDDSEHSNHEDDDHDEHGADSFGEGKAIVEVQNEGESFKLAKEAQDLMGLKYSIVERGPTREGFAVPSEALVYFNDEKGVFVKNGQWFELVEVEIVRKGPSQTIVSSNHLSTGQKVVVAGTGLLRVAHLQASGQGGKGHAH